MFQIWYLIVYKRYKLNQCQQIAKQFALNSAFGQWKVTMKHHLIRKRNEIYLRNKHETSLIIDTVMYWEEYIQQIDNKNKI